MSRTESRPALELVLREHLEKVLALVGIVRSGSIRKYALLHHLSQPAASQRLSKLEHLLNVELVHRSGKGITLTAEGQLVHDLGRELLQLTERTCEQLEAQAGRAAFLRLGSYDSIAIYFLGSIMARLRQGPTPLRSSLWCDSSNALTSRLLMGDLDVVLRPNGSANALLQVTTIFEDHYAFFCAPKADSLTLPIVTFLAAECSEGRSVESYLTESRHCLVELISVQSFEVAKSLAEQGHGVSVLPRRVAAVAVRRGSLAELRTKPWPRAFGRHTIDAVCLQAKSAQSNIARFLSACIAHSEVA
jgi:DNA-binding transcriptional LysR family regulator